MERAANPYPTQRPKPRPRPKMMVLIGAAFAALFISGCASNDARKAEAAAHTAYANLEVERARAAAEEAKAIAALAGRASQGGADAALLVRSLKGLGIGAQPPAQVQVQSAPTTTLGAAWQAILQVADIALRGYGIKSNRDVNIINSNNNRDVSLASYSAFVGMGNAIVTAGTAGYPYIQAPGAVTNNNIGGDGVIGNGTFTGAVTNTTNTTTTTTTRNCHGGTGAPGSGTGTTTPTGTGGGAPGGSC